MTAENTMSMVFQCGPMETPSAGGVKYFITYIDDY